MKKIPATFLRSLSPLLAAAALLQLPASAGESLSIWPDLAPGETTKKSGTALPARDQDKLTITRIKDITAPSIEVFAPEGGGNGAAVLILPGGGFGYVVPDLEGSEAGAILNELGITAFVLHYRTSSAGPKGAWRRPLQDSQRAIRYIRANASKWKLDPGKIGLLAFSAGGQVGAIHIGNFGNAYEPIDEIDRFSARPDFALLVYPWKVVDDSGKLMPEIKIHNESPPTFLVHTHDDASSSIGSALIYAELKKNEVEGELHVYHNGGHGYGVREKAGSNIGTWPDRAMDWLRVRGLGKQVQGEISGELKQWHKLTLSFDGPETSESATPNPFTDYRLDVTFSQKNRHLTLPGYYAADGNAADTSADSGNQWRAHFSPEAPGEWTWKASFRKGKNVATADDASAGESAGFFDNATGSFTIIASDKAAPDLRALGRLDYVGTRYPHTIGTGEVFLKAGADAPENFLAYADFDGNFKTDGIKDNLIKTWEPHVKDWQDGDPSWKDGKGKGMIGAVNYLASKGMNAVSFLTFNIEGDDRNVFPYTNYKEKHRLDVSRLAQWEIVFEHATSKGMFLHFKTQETENETWHDNGGTGPERRLYYRELIARFAHHPALNWNLGEENGVWGKNHKKDKFQTTEQRLAMGRYFEKNDPYHHPVVIHNGQWPNDLYGKDSPLHGASLQTSTPTFKNVHRSTLRILRDSAKAGKPWIVACDEPGDAQHGLVPDAEDPTRFNARTNALWGNLLAGGWGVEWYFGYAHPHSDLTCQDYRLREKMWQQSAHALHFFRSQKLPIEEMENANDLLAGSPAFCLAKQGHTYAALVIAPSKPSTIHLKEEGHYSIHWFNPREGGSMQKGTIESVKGKATQRLGLPPGATDKDWVVLVKRL